METKKDYFKDYLDECFLNADNKMNTIIELQKVANGRVTKLENELNEIRQWRATSQGHWNGVTKTVTIIASGVGAVLGILAAYLFKG